MIEGRASAGYDALNGAVGCGTSRVSLGCFPLEQFLFLGAFGIKHI